MPRMRRNRKRRVYRKPKAYRNQIARIPMPLNVKARTAIQKCTYYNSFLCDPALDSNGNQTNWAFKLQLNSPWLFNDGFDLLATAGTQRFLPNSTITAVGANSQPVKGTTTCMPGVADGPETLLKYAKGCVIGTKVTLVATPVASGDSADPQSQSGLFYTVKHSQKSSGLQASADINKINSLPFRQAKQIQPGSIGGGGASVLRSQNQIASRIVVNHSPKKFNNIADIRDNDQFTFNGGTGVLNQPEEGDFLTIGVVPMLKAGFAANGSQTQAPRFRLDMRVDQSILWTEPLEETSTGEGNYSYPYSAYNPRPSLRQLKASIPRRFRVIM